MEGKIHLSQLPSRRTRLVHSVVNGYTLAGNVLQKGPSVINVNNLDIGQRCAVPESRSRKSKKNWKRIWIVWVCILVHLHYD